jgi:Leucine-rich repeat (LRR) protein
MSIDLSNNNLNGTLPGTLFTIATSINKISFAGNLLSGKIPTEIGALPSLQSLDLSNNGFTGDIPVTFYNSSSLSSITLKNNKLSGKLADFTATPNLYTLDLTNNNIGGDISNLFCSQNSLKTLYLSNNSFTGSLPACVSKMPSLTYLFLDNNQLTSIPEMSKPQGIYYQNYCSLKNNNFECPIPQWTQDYCGAQCSF